MAGISLNCPTLHFSHEISQMHGKQCNFLTKLLQSLYKTAQETRCHGTAGIHCSMTKR